MIAKRLPFRRAALSTRKKIGLGLAVAALALVAGWTVLEGVLLLCGYGHSPRFYRQTRDADGRMWLRENRWVTAPYFPRELIRPPQPFRIPATKPPGTYRVFVLGSSAAMGDPEPAFGLARVLEALLRQAHPAVRFEVINAGITAINSHVVRTIAADCADLAPDLFIVYEGNNEVIGPYGPAGVLGPFLRSASVLRVVQAISATRSGQLFNATARLFSSDRRTLREWGGMRMFSQHHFRRDDPRLASVRSHFRANLRAIAEAGRRAGATVFLCTVLANQKDFSPFHSQHRPGLSEEEKRDWDEHFEAGMQRVDAGDDLAAETRFRAALAIDDEYAELHFQLGRVCLRRNRAPEARAFLQQALDLDVLRFRTDSRLNATILDFAGAGLSGVEVVDLAAATARASPHGILGDEFLYEHVHLNLRGTYQAALELVERVTADLVRRGIAAQPATREPLAFAELQRRLAYTAYEQVAIIKELQTRFSSPPFTAQSDNAARRQLYAQRDSAAMQLLARPDTKDALIAHYEDAVALNPDDWMLRRNAGTAYAHLGLAERAKAHLERAAAVIPDNLDTLFALASVQRILGDAAAAEKSFAALREIEPRYPGLLPPFR